MTKHDNSGILIAALVAIVAVVGLVILFKGSATGNAVCPPSQDLQMVVNPVDGQNYYECMSKIRDVTVVTRYEPEVTYGPHGSTFPTDAQKKDRTAQIVQGTWRY